MNQIHHLTSENEYETLNRILSERSDTFIAELDGAKCHNNWKSFYKLAKTAFGIALFPEDNIDGLADSLMDVFWIKQTKVALFLKNSHQSALGFCGIFSKCRSGLGFSTISNGIMACEFKRIMTNVIAQTSQKNNL